MAAGLPPPDELMEGDIVYLTPKTIPKSSIIRSHVNQSGFEDHPIVVLGKERRKGTMIVSFRLLTTFNGHTVEEKRQGDRRHQRKFFMMVDNHQDRVNSTINPVAKMAPGFDALKKRSYVNLSRNSRFEVEYEYLEAFGKDPLRRLDAKSVSYIKSARFDT
ncbi:uncharacterized protein J4E88_000437 [Alternaria novae-zelandiae]|uniref:uncharacterized protein n=1 Tax=Alternaria triticimaculans TaxID=297637 RepID=UPI0020C382DD|nr:uncharacterized protein J4E78_003167 [Alternaria triticimaculans]XP_049259943.1 uncharacterized protein J4E88_000437 [Alternaria novae-zelandiae]KAI4630521.1 hypothetical protein J4E80_001458 [Alternaria sp. BMP 0032]KAI4665703.1 hypothetical protein J4E78_003167 [Alternaria triticimaculans]KAI4696263.1 hypothetical protein J4E88_000437 [Alternaria novae-zelandiae]